MYELNGVSSTIIASYYEAIIKADKHPLANIIIVIAVKQAFHTLEPNFPIRVAESYITKLLKPYFDRKRLGIITRDFKDQEEAEKIFIDMFGELLDALDDNETEECLYMRKALHCVYDLLSYDKVIVIENETYLSSWINLEYWSEQHTDAYEKRALLQQAKPDEENIDIALNTNKAYRDKIKFLNNKVSTVNPFLKNEISEIKEKIIQLFVEEYRMTARAVYGMSQILDEHSDIPIVRAFGELEPEIDSDATIPKKDIYESWYAYVVRIYDQSSKQTAPLKKVLELAKYYSYVMFPDIPKKRALISLDKAKKPIREKSFFKGLRLYEFTDNRLKIVRPNDEVKFTEAYLLEVTKQLNRLSKS